MDRRRFLVQGVGASLATSIAVPATTTAGAAPIVVGQSAALTGPQAGFGTAMRDGVQAAIASINKSGGINGRTVQLLTLDDQGDKVKTEANVRALTDDAR